MPLSAVEASLLLGAAMHASNREVGFRATRALLDKLLGPRAEPRCPVADPTSPAVPAETAESKPVTVPLYRGRWADLEEEDE